MINNWKILVLAATLVAQLATSFYAHGQTLTPPVAAVREVADDYFGTRIVDPYRWMEESKSTELDRWMRGQNNFSRSVLDRSTTRGEFLKRIDELTNANVAVSGLQRVGDFYFYFKIAPGDRDRKLYVREKLDGAEKLLVDPATFSGAGKRFSLIAFSASQDAKRVSFLISAGGAEQGEIRVVETASGKETGDRIDRARWEAGSWLPDGNSFLYTRFPPTDETTPQTERYQKRRVYLHRLGDAAERDRAVFGFGVNPTIEIDPKLLPFPFVTFGSKYVFIAVNTGVSPNSAIYFAPVEELSKPEIAWRKIADFADEISSFAAHRDRLYLLTYKNAARFKVIKTDLQNPDLARAETIVPASDALLTDLTATRDALFVEQTDGGISRLLRVDFKTGKTEKIKLPFDGTISDLTADAREPEAFFAMESWVKSTAYFAYNAAQKSVVDTKLQPASPIDTSAFESFQVKVKASDGAMIPLSIISRKGVRRDGRNPTVITGYGAYGISQNPFFLPSFFAWLERGGVVAFAHVRGGGEYGREWHTGGFQKTKPNTWRDYLACAEYLIREKYTAPEHLAGHGASAGGILIGNAIAERPDLFGAAIIQVGLNNMLRYETTTNGVPNVPEFGSVKTEEGFKNLLAMDAYQKIKPDVKYPAVILTHGINDPRVEPWLSAKMAARLQAATASEKPVLLRIDYDAGHGIGTSRRQRNEEYADIFAFLSEQLRGDKSTMNAMASQ